MKHSILLRSTALVLSGLLSTFALEGCNQTPGQASNTAAGAPMADGGVPATNAQDGGAPVANPQGGVAANNNPQGGYANNGPAPVAAPTGYAADTSAWDQGAVTYAESPPPPLPVYEQPPAPAYGYIWTPGYWDWGGGDYYWVPGVWVDPPQVGYLWTPGYWGFNRGRYGFHHGYWGPQVGFYGGIAYGFGYGGVGYQGGYWQGDKLFYNTTVSNVSNLHVTNVYRQTVYNYVTVNRAAYNGGPSGTQARPTPEQAAIARGPRVDPTPAQIQHVQTAQAAPEQYAGANQGHPAVAATPRPGVLAGVGVVAGAGAAAVAYHALAGHPAPKAGAPAVLRSEPRPMERAAPEEPEVRPMQRPNEAPRAAQIQAARQTQFKSEEARVARIQAQHAEPAPPRPSETRPRTPPSYRPEAAPPRPQPSESRPAERPAVEAARPPERPAPRPAARPAPAPRPEARPAPPRRDPPQER